MMNMNKNIFCHLTETKFTDKFDLKNLLIWHGVSCPVQLPLWRQTLHGDGSSKVNPDLQVYLITVSVVYELCVALCLLPITRGGEAQEADAVWNTE